MRKNGAKNVSTAKKKMLAQLRCGRESESARPALEEDSLVIFPWKWKIMVELFYKTEFENVNLKGVNNSYLLSSLNG